MSCNISITKVASSGIHAIDFSNLPFGKTFSDHMFVADWFEGKWMNYRIVPFGYLPMHPACLGLHYGQSIFEGMKAFMSVDGTPCLFRPELHAKRLNQSARRMCMPDFPEDDFVNILDHLVSIDHEWVPKEQGSSLYIRPFMYANGEFFGVRDSDRFQLIILTGPVGPYYNKMVRLWTEDHYIRAAQGGTGEIKCAGNYGAAFMPQKLAQQKGFDQVLWLDAKEFKYIQEVGVMNIFFVIDGKIITPSLSGTILSGITRDSLITLCKDAGYPVEERLISIDEVHEAYRAGKVQEVFGAGTAAVIAHVGEIKYKDELMVLPPMSERKISNWLKEEMEAIRYGIKPDKFNWMHPVSMDVMVS